MQKHKHNEETIISLWPDERKRSLGVRKKLSFLAFDILSLNPELPLGLSVTVSSMKTHAEMLKH